MSTGDLCPCHIEWPLDTQGLKRDPINCEKGWLDYAVRFLSREAVGKGKGQEAVWSDKCRPQWWNESGGLKWKNPTANPKDTKDVLQKKYTALEDHLRADGRFPAELEEEAMLWREGKHKELFLFTSLASLLGKTRGVHNAVEDIKVKVGEVNAKVNTVMLDSVKCCLRSTLGAIENLYTKESKNETKKKRKLPDVVTEKENHCSQPKIRKTTEHPISVNEHSELFAKQNEKEKIIKLAKRLTEKRKQDKNVSVTTTFKQIRPKESPSNDQTSRVTTVIQINAEELNQILQSKGIRLGQPVYKKSPSSLVSSSNQMELIGSVKQISVPQTLHCPPANSSCSDAQSPHLLSGHVSASGCKISSNNTCLATVPNNAPVVLSGHPTEADSSDHSQSQGLSFFPNSCPGFDSSPPFHNASSPLSGSCPSSVFQSPNSEIKNLDSPSDSEPFVDCLLSPENITNVANIHTESIVPDSRVPSNRTESVGSENSFGPFVKSSDENQALLDFGYWSDEGSLTDIFSGEIQPDILSNLTDEENRQLCNEDGSFLLEKFLFDSDS